MKTETRFNVRYAETDQMGIVHHSNYAVWFEIGRTDFFIKAGCSYSDFETNGIMLPLYELSCQFKSPAKYGDEVSVVTSLEKISPVRLIFSYEVYSVPDRRLLATGTTMHAWTDTSLKPMNIIKRLPSAYSQLSKLLV
jgi:acyl-CoA thioester hydrolase